MALKNWSIPNFVEDTETLLLQSSSGKECILLSLIISNYSLVNSATIWVYHTDSLDNVKFKWLIELPSSNSPFALDSKIVLNENDKIKIKSSIADVSVIASGDES